MVYTNRRKIRFTEGNAKCRHLKKFTCKGTFAADVCLPEAQNLIPPPPPPNFTLYIYSHRGGVESLTREKGRRGNSSQS
jgi:hypothetical protein